MDDTIVFEEQKSRQQQHATGFGLREFPFCPKRPDQELSSEQLQLLNEDSGTDDEEAEDADDEDAEEEGEEEGGSESESGDSSDSGEDEIADITGVLRKKLNLASASQQSPEPKRLFTSHNLSDGASTIATYENASFAQGLHLDEEIVATTCPVPISPRSKYLVSCLRDNVNPRASLITRRKVSHELKMQHLGGWVGGSTVPVVEELSHVVLFMYILD